MPELVLCVDVGSTFTKAVLVDAAVGRVLGTAQHPTTLPDVMTGIAAVREELAAAVEGTPGAGSGDGLAGVTREGERGRGGDWAADGAGGVESVLAEDVLAAEILACSSAGGGLRLAVVGHERLVTAEAGQRVALSAGGRVVHLSAGKLTPESLKELRDARPDLIVLTGGTDGGNADVVVHNARRIGIARLPAPVVLACNRDAAEAAAAELRSRGRSVTVTANVLPSIGVLDPGPAREAIRAVFLEHVIGGKGLSSSRSRINGKAFRQLVLAPTPDAVLTGVEALAEGRGLLLVDVGGATTDVYSVLPQQAEGERPESGVGQAAAGDWLLARTVEGDLGVRAGALGVVEAALAEGLIEDEEARQLRHYAESGIAGEASRNGAGIPGGRRDRSGAEAGTAQPGTAQPGTAQPGTAQPGTEQPGTEQSGSQQSGGEHESGVSQSDGAQSRGGQSSSERSGSERSDTEQPDTEQPGSAQNDRRLAQLAVLTALRRHGRPAHPGAVPRPLREVGLVVGSGGVLRHATQPQRANVLNQVLTDHAGGWAVPEGAELAVDVEYTVFAAGLLSGRARPEAVRRLAGSGLEWLAGVIR